MWFLHGLRKKVATFVCVRSVSLGHRVHMSVLFQLHICFNLIKISVNSKDALHGLTRACIEIIK